MQDGPARWGQVTNRWDSATWQAKVTFKEQQQVVELEISKALPPGYVGLRAGQGCRRPHGGALWVAEAGRG